MSEKLIDEKDLRFVLFDLLDLTSLCDHEYFEEHSRETLEMTLEAAYKLARGVFWPGYRECDQVGVHLDNQAVMVPEPLRRSFAAAAEGGWIAPSAPFEYGGQQLPMTMQIAVGLILNAANVAAQIYMEGCFGTGHLLQSFASPELIDLYVENLYSGRYSGTMALTEPQAGSSLADVAMTAEKADGRDYYLLKGTKCFITSGEHDLTENIVHLTLARIKNAPEGVKGLSLFVAPKFRIGPDGGPKEPNDVVAIKIEHKMGLKGSATALLNYGENNDCRGYLVGEENKGLGYMFQMMNEARIFAGVQGIALAGNAYQQALEYTRTRLQGRPVNQKEQGGPQTPIIGHADVKRMLLTQKAYVEGIVTLVLYTTFCGDLARVKADEPGECRRLTGLYEILTPVCKAYGSETAFESVSLAMQCLGGYGYSTEFPLEQLLRDCRLFSIYEGTNGIQAQDLLGRKILLADGLYFKTLTTEMQKTMAQARTRQELTFMAEALEAAMDWVGQTTAYLLELRKDKIEDYLAPASLYLEMFSQMVVAWMHLKRSEKAVDALEKEGGSKSFYRGCLQSAAFFFKNILPKAEATGRIIRSGQQVYQEMEEDWF